MQYDASTMCLIEAMEVNTMTIKVDETLHNDMLLSVMRTQLVNTVDKLDSPKDKKLSEKMVLVIDRILEDKYCMSTWNNKLNTATTEEEVNAINQLYVERRGEERYRDYKLLGILMSKLHQAWFI